MTTKIVLERTTCIHVMVNGKQYQDDCAFCICERTPDAGFAHDYYCTHPEMLEMEGDRFMVMGYVEWSSDHQPVPTHCPLIPLPEDLA